MRIRQHFYDGSFSGRSPLLLGLYVQAMAISFECASISSSNTHRLCNNVQTTFVQSSTIQSLIQLQKSQQWSTKRWRLQLALPGSLLPSPYSLSCLFACFAHLSRALQNASAVVATVAVRAESVLPLAATGIAVRTIPIATVVMMTIVVLAGVRPIRVKGLAVVADVA